jgi:predicted HicB family RNase H-like nuclease
VPTFSVRISDDLAARFDAAAAAQGGRSARLRSLIAQAGGAGPAPARAPAILRNGARLMVRLAPTDARFVDAAAAAMGLSRAGWVAALVRRRAHGRPQFGRTDELMLRALQGELRRIGVNVNQIARALNTAVMEGRVLDLELQSLADLGRELRGHMAGLREAFEGNLAYWDTDL